MSKPLAGNLGAGNPVVTCQVCSDLGWYRRNVEPGHPDFGQAIRCSCREAEDRAARSQRLRAASNLSGRLLTKTFETFDCSRSALAREACKVLRAFAGTPEGWVLVQGNRGTGKCVAAGEVLTLANGGRVRAGDLIGCEFELLTLVDGKPQAVRAVAEFNTSEPIGSV